MTVFFKTHEVTTYKRAELYTFSNILAIGGGLLGLFLGISALSVIEFVYYFTLRSFWNIRRWKLNHVMPFRRTIIPTISSSIPNEQ